MKPQLEQLIEEEHDEVVLAEEEARKISPYRQPELSYELDIPRDVSGLVELLEEMKGLEGKIKEKFYGEWGHNLPLAVSLPGAIVGGYLAALFSQHVSDGALGGLSIAFLTVGVGLVFGCGGYFLGDKIDSKSRKLFEKNKQEKKYKLKNLNQQLSHYETKCQKGDFVLVDNEDVGYSIGEITKFEDGKFVLSQIYRKENEYPEHVTYLDEKKVICVLEDGKELSIDDLKALSEKNYVENPIVVNSKTKGTPYLENYNYGFLKKDELFVDFERKYLSGVTTLAKGEFENKIKLLTPQIKPRIKE